ncbi:hypothetical protein HNQ94_000325 [Salirhabdus euzebyi]|uniref:Sporulation lipoprotein YhcN/YlaJ (Spore_YhcN_YlaJ) n=1 Tax=Salirhabdus euzebyi TaxID=394506 RepID=A0A841PVW4_9BACI|nr:YhcN/YlaJ family sporulation lipoprotein [Salirhabdus euzebyi]MBB6451904.1 hypothetical protein [Salirhabdus euzebyi]
MKKNLIIVTTVLGITLAGCGNEANQLNNNQTETNNDYLTQPIEYRMDEQQNNNNYTPEHSANKSKAYQQELNRRSPNQKEGQTSYADEELAGIADKITEEVEGISGVVEVQTVVTPFRVLVALKVNEHERMDPEVQNKVREAVERLTNRNDVAIYTDAAYFDRIKNLNARPLNY